MNGMKEDIIDDIKKELENLKWEYPYLKNPEAEKHNKERQKYLESELKRVSKINAEGEDKERKHTPITSEEQAGFFGAELRRKREGEATQTDMSEAELVRHLKEWGGNAMNKSLTQEQENIIAEWKQRFDIQEYEVKMEGSKILVIGKDSSGNNKRFELKNEVEPKLKEDLHNAGKELYGSKLNEKINETELDRAEKWAHKLFNKDIDELSTFEMKKVSDAYKREISTEKEPKLKEDFRNAGKELYGSKLKDDINKEKIDLQYMSDGPDKYIWRAYDSKGNFLAEDKLKEQAKIKAQNKLK